MYRHESKNAVTRRQALRMLGGGFGMMAFANMVGESIASASDGPTGVAKLVYPQRVKRVIFLFMNPFSIEIDPDQATARSRGAKSAEYSLQRGSRNRNSDCQPR